MLKRCISIIETFVTSFSSFENEYLQSFFSSHEIQWRGCMNDFNHRFFSIIDFSWVFDMFELLLSIQIPEVAKLR